MENLHSCSLTESDFIPQRDTENPELFEDASSHADWFTDNETHTSCSLLGDYNRSIGLLDDLYEKNKLLERKWQDAEQKYQNLLLENQKQYLNLSNEKERAGRYHRKLQSIKSNSTVLGRLKENYLGCMCNQLQKKSVHKSHESSAQTDVVEGCGKDWKNEKLQEFEKFFNYAKSENIVAVKRSELHLMKATLQKLKVMVDRKTSKNDQEDNKAEISRLQNAVALLNDTVSKKNYEINTLKLHLNDGKKFEAIEKDNSIMRRIIIKFEKRYREVEKLCKPFRNLPILTDDEKHVVQNIFKRSGSPKPKKFCRSLSCDAANRKINNSNRKEIFPSQLTSRSQTSFITAIRKEDILFCNVSNNINNRSCYAHMEEAEKPYAQKVDPLVNSLS